MVQYIYIGNWYTPEVVQFYNTLHIYITCHHWNPFNWSLLSGWISGILSDDHDDRWTWRHDTIKIARLQVPSGNDSHSHWKWSIYIWLTHWKWWFSIAMLNYQRVPYFWRLWYSSFAVKRSNNPKQRSKWGISEKISALIFHMLLFIFG